MPEIRSSAVLEAPSLTTDGTNIQYELAQVHSLGKRVDFAIRVLRSVGGGTAAKRWFLLKELSQTLRSKRTPFDSERIRAYFRARATAAMGSNNTTRFFMAVLIHEGLLTKAIVPDGEAIRCSFREEGVSGFQNRAAKRTSGAVPERLTRGKVFPASRASFDGYLKGEVATEKRSAR